MQREQQAAMLTRRIDGIQAWDRASLQKRDWLFAFDDACQRELNTVIGDLRANPLPLLLLTPAMFAFAACRALATRVRTALKEGV